MPNIIEPLNSIFIPNCLEFQSVRYIPFEIIAPNPKKYKVIYEELIEVEKNCNHVNRDLINFKLSTMNTFGTFNDVIENRQALGKGFGYKEA